jgi:hypothetical protein
VWRGELLYFLNEYTTVCYGIGQDPAWSSDGFLEMLFNWGLGYDWVQRGAEKVVWKSFQSEDTSEVRHGVEKVLGVFLEDRELSWAGL